MVLVPGGKGNKTFKAQTQSGILYDEPYWPLTISGKEVLVKDLMKLNKQKDFDIHKKVAEDHGFRLLVKRAKIGTRKHVRVRPEFQNWMIRGTLTITDEQITKKVLQEFFDMAGKYKGLGDWRPSSPKAPGSFGMFTAEVKQSAEVK